jgi:hypothetical protein
MDDFVRDLLEQDARDWPDGHPCRACDRLHKDHPTTDPATGETVCAQWR